MKARLMKTLKDIPIGKKLIGVDGIISSTEVKRLTLSFEDGFSIECMNESYSLRVYVPEEKETKKVFKVLGTPGNGKISAIFKTRDEAEEFVKGLPFNSDAKIIEIVVEIDKGEEITESDLPF